MATLEELYADNIESTTKVAIVELEMRCRMILASAKIPTEERRALELTLMGFRASFEVLANIIEPLRENHPEELRKAYQMIFALVRTAASIGASHALTPAAKDFHRSDVEQEAAGHARRAKSEKDAVRRTLLIAAIKTHVFETKLILSKSLEFAQKIRPSVRERLGMAAEGDDWPSVSAIKGAIRQIKSVTTDSPDLM